MSSLKEKLKHLPNKPGVYLFKDQKGEIIYIGKAKRLRRRVASYFKPHPDLKTSILLQRLHDIDYMVTLSELDALLREDELIKKYRPRYNVALRDDKAYPFIKITVNEPWPRVIIARRKERDGALYFGRYQGGMVRAVVALLKKLFPIRWCRETPLKMRQQPCLYYHLGNCSGPCIGKVSSQYYRSLVDGIILLLKGKMEKALAKLEEEMRRAAAELDFERAAYLRDRIKLLEKMRAGKTNLSLTPSDRLPAEIYQLQKQLKLIKAPLRIEAFDISNIAGSHIVGAMVVFVGGAPLSSQYRRFKIRSLKGTPNDVQAIYEVVKRRYSGSLARSLELPDLVMVDGGAAQVNFGKKALEESSLARLPIIGLAKREEEIYFPGRTKSLKLPKRAPELALLQRIRDAAHRFALAFHRQKRSRGLFHGS
jgi:excinuclease ABC subunit C